MKLGLTGLTGLLLLLGGLIPPGGLWAQGNIRYVDPADQQVYGSLGPRSVYFDLNGDGVDDLRFRSDGSLFEIIPTGNNATIAITAPPPDFGSYAVHLPSGIEIGSSLQPAWSWEQRIVGTFGDYGSTLLYCNSIGCLGYWSPDGDTAYVGVRFYAGSELHYGWIRVRTFSVGGTIYDWAYNTTPDQSILAGAVPEPSAWALLVLGLGSLFFCSRRNRRRRSTPR